MMKLTPNGKIPAKRRTHEKTLSNIIHVMATSMRENALADGDDLYISVAEMEAALTYAILQGHYVIKHNVAKERFELKMTDKGRHMYASPGSPRSSVYQDSIGSVAA